MTPKFIMHSGYTTRTVEFVLSRDPRGFWKFYGRDHQGYLIYACRPNGQAIGSFQTRAFAADYARDNALPAYAIWNGRTRRYDGKGAEFIAKARDAV